MDCPCLWTSVSNKYCPSYRTVRRAMVRTFVEESIFDEFVEKFKVEMKKWTVGNPRDTATKVGALVNEIHFNKVVGYLDQAVSENMVLAGHGVEDIAIPDGNDKGIDKNYGHWKNIFCWKS